jgi:hypothetical protein
MQPVKLSPGVCQVIYKVSVLACALIPVLVAMKMLDATLADKVNTFVSVLATIAVSGPGLAAIRLGRQVSNGTFAVPGGTSAEQLAIATRNYLADEAQRKEALSGVLAAIPNVVPVVPAESITVGDAEPVNFLDTPGGCCGGTLR